ncbi:ABC-type Fe3+-siderophore transport system, permease component [Bernardetia litoralis DSM 6794]|uniref:ABC-type Fe3+-siderophore transport system, permease component n=1 Tax=Bernardetia litoralis (strain ATCC 23117 / DSM 6794 / NBRC 15988 / NCIMB 1366 / Fx l1 / Sio-4) TaxID=880071 RepID=I4ANQ9_BERLS|nr:iron ABC transporter permease [Bernardetia litoralis]AFM05594.1 ABC-type Fe3+-siderophore transport system, permease component [Bernardetia litoralis DSM 6794]
MNKQNYPFIFIVLFIVLVCLFLVNLSLGSVHIPLSEIWTIIFQKTASKSSWVTIIWEFRLPKSLTAVIVGMALSVSGLQMQTLFRNPLAGPFVLGISSGASLGVAILMLFVSGLSANHFLNSFLSQNLLWQTSIASTLGAGLVLSMVIIASIRISNNMALLIVGLMFGSATGAIVSILQYFSEAEAIKSYLLWTFGSLSQVTWDKLPFLFCLNFVGFFIVWIMHKPLDALLLGERYAQSMGLSLQKTRLGIIFTTSILAGSITAFCGPIGFIGLAVPHLTKILIKTARHKILIPAVALAGAILLLICDSISQLPMSSSVLPINAVTSLIGAPVVIWVILKKRSL